LRIEFKIKIKIKIEARFPHSSFLIFS